VTTPDTSNVCGASLIETDVGAGCVGCCPGSLTGSSCLACGAATAPAGAGTGMDGKRSCDCLGESVGGSINAVRAGVSKAQRGLGREARVECQYQCQCQSRYQAK
jgi:hypothetical protein